MYAKTGMGLLAAAGVAVGVVGITMGGASGAPASCRPDGAISAHTNTHRHADSDRSSSANAGANDSSANGAGSDSGADGAGSGDGATAATNPGTTIIAGVTVPDGVTDPSGVTDDGSSNGDSNNRSRPLLDLRENTNDTNVAGVDVPDTGNSVVVRSKDITGLHIFGSVDGR